jgi:glycosyltransferase involved in cell wall biosynthesis
MKIAIVHYYLISVRGGERCYHTLAQTFPNADLYSVVFDPASQPAWLAQRRMTTSFLQGVPGSKKFFRQFFMFYPHAVEQFDLSSYDLVISSSAGFTHGVLTPPETLHICYCYNPFRYAWNWYHDFLAGSNKLMRPLLALLLNQVRTWDIGAAQRPDYFVSISTVTQQRVAKYYRRDSTVIYPPVDLSRFSLGEAKGDYYLAFSELVPYKKMDIVVDAFNRLGKPLVVVGDGPQRDLLRSMAKPNITFRGRVPDVDLAELYRNCRALVFMPKEDFGIIPLEAMSSGKPVIAYGAGGALETVKSDETGLFFPEQTAEAVIEAVHHFEQMTFDPHIIRAHAQTFDVPIYQKRIREFVKDKLALHRAKLSLPPMALD